MQTKTIRRLNNINKNFYQEVAEEFAQTRLHFWPGWTQLLPSLSPYQPLTLLDLGCGNGRFAQFLVANKLQVAAYHGVDSSERMLDFAQKKLSTYFFQKRFTRLDLVERMLKKGWLTTGKYKVITALALIHHIPSRELRHQFLVNCAQNLQPKGLCIFTTWQFQGAKSLLNRQYDPRHLRFKPEELELNDFLLDWKMVEGSAIRYCHLCTDIEVRALLKNTGLEIQSVFDADKMNRYYICKKVRSSSPKLPKTTETLHGRGSPS